MPKKTTPPARRGPLSAHVAKASNRREFFTRSTMAFGSTVALGGSAAVTAGESLLAGASTSPPTFHVGGSDTLRIGLIGCGARGRGAAIEAIQASTVCQRRGENASRGQVKLVAMADVFANHLQTAYRTINGRHRTNVDVGNRRFVGIDGWKGVLAADVDLVILATPPAFRPLHFAAAIEAGKHVFMESPVATDMPGVRRIIAAGNVARQRGLAVAVGLQRRYEARTRDCVARIQDGAIGKLLSGHTTSSGFAISETLASGSTTTQSRDSRVKPNLEDQIRNWQEFAWASGGLTDERHLHSLDAFHWVLGQTPIAATRDQRDASRCAGVGASAVNERVPAVEFQYSDGFRVVCEHRNGRSPDRQHGELLVGEKGTCDLTRAMIRNSDGKVVWQSDAKEIPGKGWQQQFNELIAGMRDGQTANDLNLGVACTSTAILERMVTQSGRSMGWDQLMASEQSFAHPQCTL
ncbi:Gfo/Idh/MocA family protein [Rhodopirellula sp. SWK7]|uniref:Gfo/Idh/MocA family protein n=1 Tax=Rhodopirellula sp. SWK7 TaxID=595460 RepID=UPI0002BD3428|nr:Gfo/Idh/MocA family oxidoreductase [Rhodopirellula sp. SWK7]EMI45841.1 oxidoreductase domain protein [Rhodopirellula sp. SWK7]